MTNAAPIAFGLVAASLLTLGLAGPAWPATPKGALGAVAVSPDGTAVVAAGDNQVLYVIEPDTLEVRSRVHIATTPLELWYSADGSRLAMLTTDDDLVFFETGSWAEQETVEGVYAVAHAAAADSLVVLGRPKKGQDGSFATPLIVLPLGGGAPTVNASLAGEVAAIASKSDASAFAALTKQAKDESEAKQDPPADLKGLDKEVFRLQHDQQSSQLILLDGAGAETGRYPTWYSQSGDFFGIYGESGIHFLVYNNKNATFALDGSLVTVFAAPGSYNYGLGADPAQARAAVGSLRQGALVELASGTGPSFEIQALRGWPEYYKDFAFAPDGTVWAGTSSYRLVHIGADGKVLAVAPIY